MVARTPPKQKKIAAPLNPILLRETVKKVDQCMARLQELQYTVAGGNKVISGKSLSPRSTRGYLRTSLRCKQESLRIKNAAPRKSPLGKFEVMIKNAAPRKSPVGKFAGSTGEWRRMSLPAMLVGETVGEILQASQFAREIVAATKKTSMEDPKTPVTQGRKQRPQPENTELRARRKREKQVKLQSIRSESGAPSLQRARSRINFRVVTPTRRDINKENYHLSANRVSPRNKPWARKTVLFPNPLFHNATHSSHQQKFCKTRSPVLVKTRESPHKFLIKSPPSASKSQVKIKNLPVSVSPKRPTSFGKKSPPRVLSTAVKLRRSFSPSRLANRLVSPLKNRKCVQKSDGLMMMSGLKQRPAPASSLVMLPTRLSAERI